MLNHNNETSQKVIKANTTQKLANIYQKIKKTKNLQENNELSNDDDNSLEKINNENNEGNK